jgi:hypothetical protein
MKQKLLLIILLFGTHLAFSASFPADTAKVKSSIVESKSTKYGKWGFGLQSSTNGLGLQLARSIHPTNKWVAKMGFTYLPLEIKNYVFDFTGTKLKSNISINLGAIGAYVDWHPFGNAFRLTGGVAYILTNITTNSVLKDTVVQGEINLDPKKVGDIKTEFKTNPIAPYLAFGFGRAIPKKRVSFGIEVGTYYVASPKISFVCSGLLEPSSSNEAVLKENLKGYQFLPQILFNLSFKLSK